MARRDSTRIPYAQIDTLFLDIGNTLISIDFAWAAAEITALGVACQPDELCRAEAAARPAYSRRLFVERLPEGTNLFHTFLHAMIAELEAAARLPDAERASLVAALAAVLRPDGRASTLWRSVMPRVPHALDRLRALGLRLVAVSNSDGTAERGLAEAGLRSYLTAVIDSALVGYEKPDARIFERALDLSGASRDRTLHVGDIYHADVAGARGAGIHAVLLDPFGDWPETDCERLPDLWAVAGRLEEARRC